MTQQHNQTPEELFADAGELLEMALRELDAGDLRQAAEKAWGATVASANGLLVARIGEKPSTTAGRWIELARATQQDPRLESLFARYMSREGLLQGQCFYAGLCEPREAIERRIRETADLVRDAQSRAAGSS